MSAVSASSELPALTPSILETLLRGLADNPSASPEILMRLTAANIDRFVLAQRHDLTAAVAAVLSADAEEGVRWHLARNPCVVSAVRVVLARDPDPWVRGCVAEGPDHVTGFGVHHGRRVPDPLPREIYEHLSRDPEPTVRRALARNRHLPEDVRARMLEDEDSRTAAIAAFAWPSAPTGRIGELLSRATDPADRAALLHNLDSPLPAEAARAVLADIDSTAGDPGNADLLRRIAEVSDLDTNLTERFLAAPDLRDAVAANPTLSSEHVLALAGDAMDHVRAAIVARRGLDPELRESIAVDYDDGGTEFVGWLLRAEDLSAHDHLACARSRHQVFRKTLAMRPGLPDDIVEILADDDSFAVRLFVCERQSNAPGRLLARTVEQWPSFSRWDMFAHDNFPADGAARLACSDEPRDRAAAPVHPGLSAETIEALLADDDGCVRRRAATNPALPIDRLVGLLGSADPRVAGGAAANRRLPVATMHQVLNYAGL